MSFTGVPLVLVPALAPDVAILQVQRADAAGNCHAWGPTGVSAAAGKASRAVIVVAEELVDPAVIRSDPNRTFLPGFLVTAVVHLPGGAHPSPVQGHYNRDHAVYADWHARSVTGGGAAAWLDEWVREPGDHAEYLAKLGAPDSIGSGPGLFSSRRRSTTAADTEGLLVTRDYTPAELMVATAAREIRRRRGGVRGHAAAPARLLPGPGDPRTGGGGSVRERRGARLARARLPGDHVGRPQRHGSAVVHRDARR